MEQAGCLSSLRGSQVTRVPEREAVPRTRPASTRRRKAESSLGSGKLRMFRHVAAGEFSDWAVVHDRVALRAAPSTQAEAHRKAAKKRRARDRKLLVLF